MDKDWVDAYFTHGVDVSNRRVFLDQDIEESTSGPLIKGLYLMETISKEPIEMFISSFGGCVYESLAIYDIMNTITCPIYTFGFGKIMSAAVLIIAAGEQGHRWVSPNASFMHHDWAAELEGKGQELHNTVKHLEHVNERWLKLLTKHTNKMITFWTNRSRRPSDFYFSAEEALDWGVADSMWVEK